MGLLPSAMSEADYKEVAFIWSHLVNALVGCDLKGKLVLLYSQTFGLLYQSLDLTLSMFRVALEQLWAASYFLSSKSLIILRTALGQIFLDNPLDFPLFVPDYLPLFKCVIPWRLPLQAKAIPQGHSAICYHCLIDPLWL